MRAEFSPEVYMVDASTWGQGVICARVSTSAVRRELRYNDRWRWRKDTEPGGARRQWDLYTLGQAKSDDRGHGEGVNRCAWGGGKGVDWGPKSDHAGRAYLPVGAPGLVSELHDGWAPPGTAGVPNLHHDVLHAEYHLISSQSWDRLESIPVLEGRSVS